MGWSTGRSRFDPRQKQEIFPLTSVSRPAFGSTQPPVQWLPGVKRGRGVTLTTHPHLVPGSRMSRRYTSSPPSAFWRVVGQLYKLLCYPQENEINKPINRESNQSDPLLPARGVPVHLSAHTGNSLINIVTFVNGHRSVMVNAPQLLRCVNIF
jgi:hypothetical protein